MSSECIKKVCVFTETYYPIIGGGESQAVLLNSGLVENNIQVLVVVRRNYSALKKEEVINNVRVRRIKPIGKGNFQRWVMIFTSVPVLIKERKNYDLIFVSGFRTLGIPAVLVSKIFRKISILKSDTLGEMSGNFFLPGLQNIGVNKFPFLLKVFLYFRNLLFKKADAYVSLSKEITSEFKNSGVDQSKIYEIPNCIDPEKFFKVTEDDKVKLRTKLNLPVKGKILIFTGRLVLSKGLPLLVNVWNEIQKKYKDAMLLIVGSGKDILFSCEEEIKNFVKENKLEGSVRFTGFVNSDEIHEYVKSSDIFVLPSESEALPVSLIEAMACGLVPIVTPVGGIKDVIKNNFNGLLMNVGDFKQLYHFIELLINNENLLKKMGENALLTVSQKYSKSIVLKSYIDLFNKLNNSK
ncbi:MAG TPA: glycosyltransferase family 4 protein [Ignavibacteriaceae bacterium]|nr:glycosyltransferase family 4 protein [Ignavibacteriaceae bacterium]